MVLKRLCGIHTKEKGEVVSENSIKNIKYEIEIGTERIIHSLKKTLHDMSLTTFPPKKSGHIVETVKLNIH